MTNSSAGMALLTIGQCDTKPSSQAVWREIGAKPRSSIHHFCFLIVNKYSWTATVLKRLKYVYISKPTLQIRLRSAGISSDTLLYQQIPADKFSLLIKARTLKKVHETKLTSNFHRTCQNSAHSTERLRSSWIPYWARKKGGLAFFFRSVL